MMPDWNKCIVWAPERWALVWYWSPREKRYFYMGKTNGTPEEIAARYNVNVSVQTTTDVMGVYECRIDKPIKVGIV